VIRDPKEDLGPAPGELGDGLEATEGARADHHRRDREAEARVGVDAREGLVRVDDDEGPGAELLGDGGLLPEAAAAAAEDDRRRAGEACARGGRG
jgi:hypothetical protein